MAETSTNQSEEKRTPKRKKHGRPVTEVIPGIPATLESLTKVVVSAPKPQDRQQQRRSSLRSDPAGAAASSADSRDC